MNKWNRRSRIGAGLRPYADVPLGEEREEYSLYFPDATPPRTMPAIVGMVLPALLRDASGAVVGDGNSFELLGPAATHRSLQVIPATGNFFEAEMGAGVSPNTHTSQFGLIAPSGDWENVATSNTAFDILVVYSKFLSGSDRISRFTVYERGVSAGVYNYSDPSNYLTAPRIRILMSGSEFRVYLNWASPSSVPIHVTGIAPAPPYIVGMYASSTTFAYLAKAVMTIGPQPATVYSAAQQTADGLTPGDPVTVQIGQVSAILGLGAVTEATI